LIKTDPEFFLKSFKKYVYRNSKYTYDVKGLLENYGDEFVDNPERDLAETKKRIESLKQACCRIFQTPTETQTFPPQFSLTPIS